MKTIVINLFGEPSAGKSTCAMDITAKLKRNGITAEYISEFAKDKVWENDSEVFRHQEYIFGKQSFKMGRVKDKVQVMVVDSPLILSAVYDRTLGKNFCNTVLDIFNSYNNKNYFLVRNHSYESEGRLHNEQEAAFIKQEILDKLNEYRINYDVVISNEETCDKIVDDVIKEVKNEQ